MGVQYNARVYNNNKQFYWMSQSPQKIIPLINHKFGSNFQLQRKIQDRQIERLKNCFKNTFRIKRQIKSLCIDCKQLKIQGTMTRLKLKDHIIRINKTSPNKKQQLNISPSNNINNSHVYINSDNHTRNNSNSSINSKFETLEYNKFSTINSPTRHDTSSSINIIPQVNTAYSAIKLQLLNRRSNKKITKYDKYMQKQAVLKITQTVQKTQKNQAKRIKTLPKLQSFTTMGSKQNSDKLLKINKTKKTARKIDKPLLLSLCQRQLKCIKAQHYFMIEDSTRQQVIAYRSKTKIQVASLTKIMTFYSVISIALDKQVDIQKQSIKIKEQFINVEGTSANLLQNQIYTIQQLLYGLMLPSGNDAALALAHWGGKLILQNSQSKQYTKQFIKRMNQECVKLELIDTTFGNSHGLPHRDSRTTCEDMALLCSFCLKIPIFKEVVSTQIYKYKTTNSRTKKQSVYHWQNTNKLLRRPGFIGIKTGITITAGPCLASAYCFRDKTYIIVLAKSSKMSRRFKDTRLLVCHCLSKIYGNQLTKEQRNTLKKLRRANQDIDSDYSDEQQQFNFETQNIQELKKRARIVTEY